MNLQLNDKKTFTSHLALTLCASTTGAGRWGEGEGVHRQLTVFDCKLRAVGLTQSLEPLTAEREVVGSIPGAGPTLRVLK